MSPLPLTWNEALSGAWGSISLAAWIFLLVPQLIENYSQGHADGISLTFLFIWFLGDITNLAGALWAGLVPTVVALAVYFCFADTVLIAQCLYYLAAKRRRNAAKSAVEEDVAHERSPLLDDGRVPSKSPASKRRLTDVTDDNLGLPGSRRRSSVARDVVTEQESTHARAVLKNSVSFLGVILVGAAGWAVAWRAGAWRPTPIGEEDGDTATPLGAEILGYISAVCYLGARIPQIVKNQRERSCEGLSLLFFMLSLLGNLSYGAGILFHSVEKRYVLTNLPWLIGSLGTMFEDIAIFIQFHMFGEKKDSSAIA